MRIKGQKRRTLTRRSVRGDLPDNSLYPVSGSQGECCALWLSCFTQQEQEFESTILIPHNNEDTIDDEFGVRLCSYIDRVHDGTIYYRHFLVGVRHDGPAAQMQIDNNDELVLLRDLYPEDIFLPEHTHTEVLKLFRNVKVDGKTRFTLILRRRIDRKTGKCKWIETSAILAPDNVDENRPIIEYPEYKQDIGDKIEVPKCEYMYKVRGTQRYLNISNGVIDVDTLANKDSDETKRIWKRVKYWQADKKGHIEYAAALCDYTMTWYIAINSQKDIVLQSKPAWFKVFKTGSDIRFKLNSLYLAYNTDNDGVNAGITNCVFEELPVPDNPDEPASSLPDLEGAMSAIVEAPSGSLSRPSSVSSSRPSSISLSRHSSISSSRHSSISSSRPSSISSSRPSSISSSRHSSISSSRHISISSSRHSSISSSRHSSISSSRPSTGSSSRPKSIYSSRPSSISSSRPSSISSASDNG